MKTNQSYKEALFSSSCPYSFDQKFVTPTTLIHLSALDLSKSALIYSECQMNHSCCLLSLWPQNRSLNYLWTFLCLGCQKLPVWRRPQRCRISCPSFPKHRASNHPSLQLQAWRWSSMSPISERECYHHQSSTIHATTIMCISCSSMSVWYWHSTYRTSTGAYDQLGCVELHQLNLAPSPRILSHILSPIYLVSVASKGCFDLMQRKATMQGWPPLNVLSPPHMVTKPWVVVIGFGWILHMKYHDQRLHSLLYACMELDFNSKFSFLFR